MYAEKKHFKYWRQRIICTRLDQYLNIKKKMQKLANHYAKIVLRQTFFKICGNGKQATMTSEPMYWESF